MREEAFLEALAAKLAQWRASGAAGFAVAFSGGCDSTLLLNALARLDLDLPVRALHVDHGLSPASQTWEADCRSVAATLGISYASVRIVVARDSGLGLEAAAREQRYRALEEMLDVGEILLTAHHGDDQLETVLLRMLRGAGTRGLRGIVELAPFGRGYLGRPLLSFSKLVLREQARAWALAWVEDPANDSLAHDRNYLRHRVVPALQMRWPAAPRMAQRLAEQMADAEEILETMGHEDARALAFADRVAADELMKLSPSRQRNLLRHLLRTEGLPIPSAQKLEELRDGALESAWDARTEIHWPGGEARFYRGALHFLAPLAPASGPLFCGSVDRTRTWVGPEGRLGFVPSEGEEAQRAVKVAEARLTAAQARLEQRDETLRTGGGAAAGQLVRAARADRRTRGRGVRRARRVLRRRRAALPHRAHRSRRAAGARARVRGAAHRGDP